MQRVCAIISCHRRSLDESPSPSQVLLICLPLYSPRYPCPEIILPDLRVSLYLWCRFLSSPALGQAVGSNLLTSQRCLPRAVLSTWVTARISIWKSSPSFRRIADCIDARREQ
jgi:hypothetical protein